MSNVLPEDVVDVDVETAIIEWARSPDALQLNDMFAALDPALADTNAAESQIIGDRWPATTSTDQESCLSPPTVTDGTVTYAHLSGGSRMENSGNTYTLINNYFNDGGSSSKTSSSLAVAQSTLDRSGLTPAPISITTMASTGSSVSEPSRSSLSAPARPTSQLIGGHGMDDISTDLIMEGEDGCYVETITPQVRKQYKMQLIILIGDTRQIQRGNIPFHSDTPQYIRAFMASAFNFGETLIPLWKPRRRQFPVRVSEVGMIGDVGYFDAEGGFYSLFNIFLTEQENKSYKYSPPTDFREYSTFRVREGIIDSIRIRPRESLSQGLVNFCAHGKFRHVKQDKFSELSFRSEKLVTSSAHGSVIVYHDSLLSRLDEDHPPARKECIQPYLNRNAAQWYTHYNIVRKQRPPLKNGQLMLVHTSWSTDSWASAVFSHENDWELGEYFADLTTCDSGQECEYAWKAHDSVWTKTSHPQDNIIPTRSDHCIAVGVNSIFIGDPPGRKRNKMRRGLHSLSQSVSSFSKSVSSFMTIGKRGNK